MAENPTKIEFQFVNSTINAPTVPRDLAIRALIRKQAMKKASAARRRDGNYGKHNLRQYPVFLFNQDNNSNVPTVTDVKEQPIEYVDEKPISPSQETKFVVEEHKTARRPKSERNSVDMQHALAKKALSTSLDGLPGSLSAKGYELTSMRSDFDLLDLSTLASLHVGRAARAALSKNPYHLIYQLRSHKKFSYLSYLPSLYGHVPCLSDAADCVIARARQIISPHENWEAAVITFYVKALDSLQKALDSPKQRYRPEVLCATEILSLYELLDPSGETGWIRHAAGAARLIQLRGPKNYNTDFEKALFMAHTGPIMTECLLNGQRCFLEQKPWQKVFRSLIVDDCFPISDQSEICISLIMLKAFMPGFFVDVTNIICSETEPDLDVVHTTAGRLRQQRAEFLKWSIRYQEILAQYPDMSLGSSEYDSHCKVYSTFLSCMMISTRLLAAISASERSELESLAQGFADEMIELDQRVRSSSTQTGLFMAQTHGVAGSLKNTEQLWQDDRVGDADDYSVSSASSSSASTELIGRWKFECWAKGFGRKML